MGCRARRVAAATRVTTWPSCPFGKWGSPGTDGEEPAAPVFGHKPQGRERVNGSSLGRPARRAPGGAGRPGSQRRLNARSATPLMTRRARPNRTTETVCDKREECPARRTRPGDPSLSPLRATRDVPPHLRESRCRSSQDAKRYPSVVRKLFARAFGSAHDPASHDDFCLHHAS